MTELKTFKEIYKECENEEFPCEEKLRRLTIKEAIKWIKEINNFKKSSEDLMWEEFTGKTIEYSKDSITGLKNWIKHFFNIQDNELK